MLLLLLVCVRSSCTPPGQLALHCRTLSAAATCRLRRVAREGWHADCCCFLELLVLRSRGLYWGWLPVLLFCCRLGVLPSAWNGKASCTALANLLPLLLLVLPNGRLNQLLLETGVTGASIELEVLPNLGAAGLLLLLLLSLLRHASLLLCC